LNVAFARAELPSVSGWKAFLAEWLAGLFVAAPTKETVENYRQELGVSFFEILAKENGCAAGAELMRSALSVEVSSAAIARALGVAFTQLFDGVGGYRTVSLYESAYVGVSGRLFQAPCDEMDKLLRRSDVSSHASFREPSDHLSIELALLARFIHHDASSGSQIDLLDNHLLVWVPRFAEQCRKRDRTGFYAGASQVLMAFLVAQRASFQLKQPAKPTTGITSCPID
jgi:TorA-specific chaperone